MVLVVLFDLADLLLDLNDIFIDGLDFGFYFHLDLVEEFHKFILGDFPDKLLLLLWPEEVGVSKGGGRGTKFVGHDFCCV